MASSCPIASRFRSELGALLPVPATGWPFWKKPSNVMVMFCLLGQTVDSCCSLFSSLSSLVRLKEFMRIFYQEKKKPLFFLFSSFSLRCPQTMKELSVKIHLVLSREKFFLLCFLENTVRFVAGTKPYRTRFFSIPYAPREVSSPGCSLGEGWGAPGITRVGASPNTVVSAGGRETP